MLFDTYCMSCVFVLGFLVWSIFIIISIILKIVQGNLALFCTHSLDLGDDFSLFIIILLVSCAPAKILNFSIACTSMYM